MTLAKLMPMATKMSEPRISLGSVTTTSRSAPPSRALCRLITDRLLPSPHRRRLQRFIRAFHQRGILEDLVGNGLNPAAKFRFFRSRKLVDHAACALPDVIGFREQVDAVGQ